MSILPSGINLCARVCLHTHFLVDLWVGFGSLVLALWVGFVLSLLLVLVPSLYTSCIPLGVLFNTIVYQSKKKIFFLWIWLNIQYFQFKKCVAQVLETI